MRKQDIVVHIKDEQMLNEAREILESAGEKVADNIWMVLTGKEEQDVLFFDNEDKEWMLTAISIARKYSKATEITLAQLKDLLNRTMEIKKKEDIIVSNVIGNEYWHIAPNLRWAEIEDGLSPFYKDVNGKSIIETRMELQQMHQSNLGNQKWEKVEVVKISLENEKESN